MTTAHDANLMRGYVDAGPDAGELADAVSGYISRKADLSILADEVGRAMGKAALLAALDDFLETASADELNAALDRLNPEGRAGRYL